MQIANLTSETFKDPISGIHYGEAVKNEAGLYWQEQGGFAASDIDARLWTSGQGLKRAMNMIASTGTYTGSHLI